MKYGESTFDILYLVFAICSGFVMLRKARNKTGKLMGGAALILGIGDAFHLVPRVLNYFVESDFTAALGIGKLVTSITMTVFYVVLYYIWQGSYGETVNRNTSGCIWGLTILRIALCLFPQNGWAQKSNDMTWGIIRNIPFVILGAMICLAYFRKRKANQEFRFIWLFILLSFLFYIPVAVGAGIVPMLGMLMLPKTICYMLMIWTFLRSVKHS